LEAHRRLLPGLWTQSSNVHHTPPFFYPIFGPSFSTHEASWLMPSSSSSSRQGARRGSKRRRGSGYRWQPRIARWHTCGKQGASPGVFNVVALQRQEIDLFGLFIYLACSCLRMVKFVLILLCFDSYLRKV
jgi:hypothetical protein